MKTKILHLVVAFCFLGSLPVKTVALNYTISFTGTGASTTVDSVIVQNLTRGTSITVPGGNVLNLSDVPTAVEPLNANNETIRVYPASVDGKFIVSFFAKQAGSTQLSVFSIDGRKIAGINTDLPAGNNTFELSTPKGVFVIQVKGNEYSYTDKMLNTSGMQSNPGIVYTGTAKPTSTGPQKTKSSIPGITTMTYTAGDQLLYKAVSGNYSTIVTDVPTGDKTTNFNFVACMDADGNNYSMVTIGTQLWMAENLKTTQYNDSTAIPFITDSTAWANQTTPCYCWYNNDAGTYKNMYGALYNWYTVNTGKLAPKGWHVPTDADLQTLKNYLIANGYNYDGSTQVNVDSVAKSLAAITNWIPDTGKGTIGNDLSKNNRTGFSALPGGCRINGGFYTAGSRGDWWSSTGSGVYVAIRWELNYNGSDLDWSSGYGKPYGFSIRCVRDIPSLPTLTTTAASSITTTTATTGGNITNDGGASITARGVCWSTSVNPTIADSLTTGGTGAGIFTSDLTGLTANTTYYLRAYATNSVGTAYGTQVSFTTDVTDIDGNVYHTVTIGTQTWMKENLKTTKYNDGTTIPLVTDNDAWANLTTPGFCWYNNDSSTYKNIYGALYNWYAVNTGKLAPKGWHVPTDAEWTTLQNYLIANGYNYDGSNSGNFIAKSLADTISWATDTGTGTIGNDLTKNNRSGFSAQPGGCRYDNGFRCEGINGLWWNSNGYDTFEAWFMYLQYCNSNMGMDIFNESSGFSVRCLRDTLSLPTLTTTAASSITETTATTGGNITYDGGASITARGICWSTSANPTIADLIAAGGTGAGAFSSALTGLTANTTYYIRAFATNSVGTGYGAQLSFTTAVTDKDGNVYHTFTIGTQTWMKENLKTTKYNDGTAIPLVTDNTAWWNVTTPGYCWYNNDSVTYKNRYGALYNWYAVNTGKLAPKGWHVPTDAEWTTLQNYLIANGYNYDGSTSGNFIAKSLADTIGWASDTGTGTIGNDLSKNNSSGFSGLPCGIRDSGGFDNATVAGYWWSSTEGDASDAWSRHLDNDNRILYSNDYQKNYGFSVRCVRDTLSLPTLTTTTVSSIATTTATTGGNITNDGGTPVTARGICWSTSANPTIADSITPCGTGAGTFTSDLTGLTANTTYYIRAYATNSAGTVYGTQLSFTTAVTDKDGNVYHTVTIGTQIWMAENLKTTKYNDGTAIPLVTDNTAWWNLTTPGYCWYNNDSVTYKNTYGALYNWYSVSTGNLAPKGWHVATDAEWTTLQNYLIANGYNYDGSTSNNLFGKSLADTISWATDTGPGAIGNDLSKNNSTGFSALPGGYRDNSGFNLAGWHGYWWSSAEFNTGVAWFRRLINTESDLYLNYVGENYGFSVRCVRDN